MTRESQIALASKLKTPGEVSKHILSIKGLGSEQDPGLQ